MYVYVPYIIKYMSVSMSSYVCMCMSLYVCVFMLSYVCIYVSINVYRKNDNDNNNVDHTMNK